MVSGLTGRGRRSLLVEPWMLVGVDVVVIPQPDSLMEKVLLGFLFELNSD